MALFNYIQVPDEGDYGDYTSKWEYLGKGRQKFAAFVRTGSKWPICSNQFKMADNLHVSSGIWENQDYGSISNYSTLKTNTQRHIRQKKTQPKMSISILFLDFPLKKYVNEGFKQNKKMFQEKNH